MVVSYDHRIIHQQVSPGDITDMEGYHGEVIKNKCIKHILEFYIGNGKGVATTLKKTILKYPIQLVQIQRKVISLLFIEVLHFFNSNGNRIVEGAL